MEVWGGAQERAFLSSLVRPLLLVQGPHFGNHWATQPITVEPSSTGYCDLSRGSPPSLPAPGPTLLPYSQHLSALSWPSHLQDFQDLQFGLHHHNVFIVLELASVQRLGGTSTGRQAGGTKDRLLAAQHHGGHHVAHALDGPPHVLACGVRSTRGSRGCTAGPLGLTLEAGLTQKGFLGEVSFKPNLGKEGLARAKVNCVGR